MNKVTSVAAVLREIYSGEQLIREAFKWIEANPDKLNMFAAFVSTDSKESMGFEAHLCTAMGLTPKSKHDSGTSIYVDVSGQPDLANKLRKLAWAKPHTVMMLPFGTLASAYDVCCAVFGWSVKQAEAALIVETGWPVDTAREYRAAYSAGDWPLAYKIAVRQIKSALGLS